jgi:hypothetical protein
MSKTEAEDAFRREVDFHRNLDQIVGGSGWSGEADTNFALGRNVLKEEIGDFGEWQGPKYALDQATRDVLLAHARQDAASAAAMARSAFREAHAAAALSRRAVALLILSAVLNMAIAAAFWLSQ